MSSLSEKLIFESIWQDYSIPSVFSSNYRIVNCYKDFDDKKIYLLDSISPSNGSLILKIATGKKATQLSFECQFYEAQKEKCFPWMPELKYYKNDTDYAYLLRDYINGPSLCDYYEKRMILSNEEILTIAIEIGYIIKDLHSLTPPVIHRDIKPENFVRNTIDGKWYLIDYDTVRQFSPEKSRDTTLLGTPDHAAPEQFGYSQSDTRTDIYAFGKTLLYLCTGTSDESILKRANISPFLRRIIAKCICFSPAGRYKNMNILLRKLKQVNKLIRYKNKCLLLLLLLIMFAFGYYAGSFHNSSSTIKPKSTTEAITQNQPLYSPGALSNYKEITDKIIIDYTNENREELVKDYEKLLIELANDEALAKIKGTDYAGYSALPEDEQYRSQLRCLKDFLVYRDSILLNSKNDLSPLKNYIYNSIDSFIVFEHSCLYLYATNTLDENGYSVQVDAAMTDLIRCLTFAFDQRDHIDVHPW